MKSSDGTGRSRSTMALIEALERRQLLTAALPTVVQTNLVSDGATPAAVTDANLLNPWGIAETPSGAIWVADNGAGVSTVYNSAGMSLAAPVTIPPPAGSGGTAAPTGVILHRGAGFNITSGSNTGPSTYLFATEDGTVSGWNFAVDPTHAILEIDKSSSNAVFKGIAISGSGNGSRIFVTDFHNNAVDVFDSKFNPVALPAGSFTDSTIPSGFAPFGIHMVRGKLYVTYALQNAEMHDDVAGPGNGFVDIFTTRGKLVKRFASGGALNSPWAVTQGVGRLSGDILVGNFGDGAINVFNSRGTDVGPLQNSTGQAVVIDGLWDLTQGSGKDRNTLFFAAGTNHEADGLFGTLKVATTTRAQAGSGTPSSGTPSSGTPSSGTPMY